MAGNIVLFFVLTELMVVAWFATMYSNFANAESVPDVSRDDFVNQRSSKHQLSISCDFVNIRCTVHTHGDGQTWLDNLFENPNATNSQRNKSVSI